MRKNAKLLILTLVFLSILTVGLISCNKINTISFIIDNKTVSTVNTDKKGIIDIEQVNIPKKEGYKFKGWFLDEDFTKPFDKDSKIKDSIKVYGKFELKKFDLFVSDSLFLQNVSYFDLENNLPLKENKKFDYWYTDRNCTTKFDANSDTTKLYARYINEVEFYNNYETIKTVLVEDDHFVEQPKAEDIVSDYIYMDKDLKFYDSETLKEFDFKEDKITKNKRIIVKWATPNINYAFNNKNNTLSVVGISDVLDYPVISIPDEAYFKGGVINGQEIEQGNYKVTSINLASASINKVLSLKKIIISDNVESIAGLNLNKENFPSVEEYILPKNLKIIENSFNGINEDIKLNIPKSVEIITSAFWGVNSITDISPFSNFYKGINVKAPKEVKMLANVPENLDISECVNFVKEDNIVYNKDKDTLIAAYFEDKNYDLSKVNVEKIHAGAFLYNKLNRLILPETFMSVELNDKAENYGYYLGKELYVDKRNDFTKIYDAILGNLDLMEGIAYSSFRKHDDIDENLFISLKVINYTECALTYKDDPTLFSKFFINGSSEDEDEKVSLILYLDINGKKSLKIVEVAQGVLDVELLSKACEWPNLDNIKITNLNIFDESAIAINSYFNKNLYLSVEIKPLSPILKLQEDNNELVVIGFEEDESKLNSEGGYSIFIPEEINGKKVVKIEDNAFKNKKKITDIYISNTVEIIGKSAFENTDLLKKVVIKSGSLRIIKRDAFKNSGLEEIVLPLEKVENIEPFAFSAKNLSKFIVPEEEINRSMFSMLKNPFSGKLYEPFFGERMTPILIKMNPSYKFKITGEKGKYYIARDCYRSRILKVNDYKEENDEFIVDLQLISTATKKCSEDYYSYILPLGYTGKQYGLPVIISYELMEGSITYGNSDSPSANIDDFIHMINVKKAHKDSVTLLNPIFLKEFSNLYKYIGLYHSGISESSSLKNENYLKKEDFNSKFAEGWLSIDESIDVTNTEIYGNINKNFDCNKLQYFSMIGSNETVTVF